MNIDEYKKSRLENLIELHLPNKIEKLVCYLMNNNITDVTVGFSGGADSTAVLLLLTLAQDYYDFDIHAVTVISHDKKETSFHYGDVDWSFKTNSRFRDIKKYNVVLPENNRVQELFPNVDIPSSIIHQSYYQYMYNVLFTYSQLNNAITIGTTNLDELSYVGWFGKSSDMVVDLQIISDLHKFEIYEILKYYGVSVLKEPTGDMPDSLLDVEYFGTDYDTLAHYSWCRCNNMNKYIKDIGGIEKLHNANKHKYYGQSFNPYFIKDDKRFFIFNANKG